MKIRYRSSTTGRPARQFLDKRRESSDRQSTSRDHAAPRKLGPRIRAFVFSGGRDLVADLSPTGPDRRSILALARAQHRNDADLESHRHESESRCRSSAWVVHYSGAASENERRAPGGSERTRRTCEPEPLLFGTSRKRLLVAARDSWAPDLLASSNEGDSNDLASSPGPVTRSTRLAWHSDSVPRNGAD